MSLAESWEAEARAWIAWARAPHDSYWRHHRDQFFELLPPPGRCTVDVGSGEGRVSRDLAARGHRVIGVEPSRTLVEAARAVAPELDVRCASATSMPLADRSADLAVAFMSLHDMDDMDGAVREIARVLAPGGVLCAAVVHPLNACGTFEARARDARFAIAGDYLRPHRYSSNATHGELAMTFHSMHRTFEMYISALLAAGLQLDALREPALPDAAVRTEVDRRWQRIPLFLHLRARRP